MSAVVVGALAALVMLGNWLCFRRARLARPPLRLLDRTDMALLFALALLLPHCYDSAVIWVLAPIFGVIVISAGQLALSLILPSGAAWLLCLALVTADVVLELRQTNDPAFFAVNDVLLGLAAISISTLWSQSGLTVRDLVAFAVTVGIVELLGAALTQQEFARADDARGPLFPLIAWRDDGTTIGLSWAGLLIAGAYVTTMHRVYGRTASLFALMLVGAAVVLATAALGAQSAILTLTPLLGALIAAHCAFHHLRGRRDTPETARVEPPAARVP